jgi:hypothetical protein
MKWQSLKIFASTITCFLLLSGCNLFPEPESLIQVPKQVKAAQGQGIDFVTIAAKNLPKGTELTVPNGPVGVEPVIAGDFDGDGKEEILVLYRSISIQNQVGVFVLKKEKGNWEKIFAKKGTGSEISWASVSDVTGDERKEVLLGWQLGGASGNILEIYSWKKAKLAMLEQLNYHELDVIQFEKDPKTRIALWNRDLADVYKIQLLDWDGKMFVPDTNHYRPYFQKVIDYYKLRTSEVPDAAYYWYYLADAYFKTNHLELALEAVNRGMNLKTVVPSFDQFVELKDHIEAKNAELKNMPVQFEVADPDLSFDVSRDLAPYISTKREQGTDDSYIISVEISPDKKIKKSLFSIEVYPRDRLENITDSKLVKIGETEEHIYFVRRGNPPTIRIKGTLINGAVTREQIISSIQLGSVNPKFTSLEDQFVITFLKEATSKYSYVMTGGKMPEGEIKTISINDSEFRYLGKDLDTNSKLMDYLSNIYTNEAIQSFKNKAKIFEYFGKLVQPNADIGSLLNYNLAEVIQKKDNGNEKEFDVKVPLGNSYNFEVIHIGFQKNENGWRIFSEPGTF